MVERSDILNKPQLLPEDHCGILPISRRQRFIAGQKKICLTVFDTQVCSDVPEKVQTLIRLPYRPNVGQLMIRMTTASSDNLAAASNFLDPFQ